MGTARARRFNWGESASELGGPFDVVLASDLVFIGIRDGLEQVSLPNAEFAMLCVSKRCGACQIHVSSTVGATQLWCCHVLV